jgi:predicted MFS family arabinose efflux permease
MGALVMSIVGDAISPAKRGQAMGLFMASFSLASVFGVPFGIVLANRFDWRAVLLTTLLTLGQFLVIPFIAPSLVANVGFREDQLPLM